MFSRCLVRRETELRTVQQKTGSRIDPQKAGVRQGFLVIPCITAPERAKAIPVSPAASALGIRIFNIIIPTPEALAGNITVSAKALKLPPAMPVQTERTIENPSSSTNAARIIRKPARSVCISLVSAIFPQPRLFPYSTSPWFRIAFASFSK